MGTGLRFLALALLGALAGPAAAQSGGATWYSIAAGNDVLGHASQESVTRRGGGRETVEVR